MLKVKSESVEMLTQDEYHAVQAAVAGIVNIDAVGALDCAADELKAWFPDWFVYRGGSHVALHRTRADDRRVLIITQAPGKKAIVNGGYCS